jgi:acetamidase/formamidase
MGQQLAQQQAASGGLPAQMTPLLGMLGLGRPASAATPPAGAITPVPPPQNGGKIVIYGLDGGPKEIPAK